MNAQTDNLARTALNTNSPNSLNNGAYLLLGTIERTDNNTNDFVVEIGITPGTVSGNKQVVVFAKYSIDGTNFTTGPESGTTTTDEPNLKLIGFIPVATNATRQVGEFSIADKIGFIPESVKIIIKNDSGAQLAASGNDAFFCKVTNPIE